MSARDHAISVYSKNSNEITNLSTFAAKGTIHYVTVAMCSFHKTVCEIIYSRTSIIRTPWDLGK